MNYNFGKAVKHNKVLFAFFIILIVSVLVVKSFYDSYVDPDNVLNTKITSKNLNNIVDVILDKKTELNNKEIIFIEKLHFIYLGRHQYFKYLTNKGDIEKAESLLDNYRFNTQSRELFDFIVENNFTLNDFFNYFHEKEKLRLKFDDENSDFYKKVDRYNLDFQKHVDMLPDIKDKKIDKLNDKFSIKFDGMEVVDHVQISPDINAFFPVFGFKIKGINHSSESIRYLTYTVYFINDKGQKVYNIKSSSPTNTYVGNKYNNVISITPSRLSMLAIMQGFDTKKKDGEEFFPSIEKDNESQIYEALRQGVIQDAAVRVTTLITDKKAYPDLGEFEKYAKYGNRNYKTAEKLNGYGPYSTEEMFQRKKALDVEWNQLMRERFGLLSEFDSYVYLFYLTL